MARTVTGRKATTKKASVKKAAVKKAAAPTPAKKKAPAPKKAAVKKAVAAKKAAPAKKAPQKKALVKKAVARVPAVRRPPPRRARAATPVRRKAAAAPIRKTAPQSFTVSHLNEADFRADGLRPYALYRDLGIAAATGGLCQAHVIRFLSPCTDEVRKRHTHDVELQLVYVLKGWVKNEFEGHGPQMMSTGSCWLQPSGIKHTVLDFSPDVELLEIIVPADFKTTELT